MRFTKNTPQDASKVLRLPRKMTMDASKVLRLPRKLQHIFWKRRKSIAPATQNDLRHVAEHVWMSRSATPATRNEAARRLKPPKRTTSVKLPIGTAIRSSRERLRTVANGCARERNVERTHPQPPDPQSETGTLATHSGKSWFIHYWLMNVNDISESTSHNQSFNSSPSPLSRTRPLPQLRQLVSSSKHGRTRTTTLTRQMVHGKPKEHRNQTASDVYQNFLGKNHESTKRILSRTQRRHWQDSNSLHWRKTLLLILAYQNKSKTQQKWHW